MGNGLHHLGLIGALLAASPAFAVGHNTIADTGTRAPKERRWDPYAHTVPDRHLSVSERANELRKDCERHHKETCVRQLKPIKTDPLRDDLKAVTP